MVCNDCLQIWSITSYFQHCCPPLLLFNSSMNLSSMLQIACRGPELVPFFPPFMFFFFFFFFWFVFEGSNFWIIFHNSSIFSFGYWGAVNVGWVLSHCHLFRVSQLWFALRMGGSDTFIWASVSEHPLSGPHSPVPINVGETNHSSTTSYKPARLLLCLDWDQDGKRSIVSLSCAHFRTLPVGLC